MLLQVQQRRIQKRDAADFQVSSGPQSPPGARRPTAQHVRCECDELGTPWLQQAQQVSAGTQAKPVQVHLAPLALCLRMEVAFRVACKHG